MVAQATTMRYVTAAGRGYAKPGPGRGTYRLVGCAYVHEPMPCDGCGALLQPDEHAGPDRCVICGTNR